MASMFYCPMCIHKVFTLFVELEQPDANKVALQLQHQPQPQR